MDFDQDSAIKPQDVKKETLTRSPCSRSPSRGLGKLNEVKPNLAEQDEGGESDCMSEDRHTPLLKYANELLNQTLRKEDGRSSQQRRQEHVKNIQKQKPWERSTGPKTAAGKAKSAHNAYQHGFRSQDYSEILKLLKIQRESVKRLNAEI